MTVSKDAREACRALGLDPKEVAEAFWAGVVCLARRPGSWEAALAADFLEAHGCYPVETY